MKVLGFFLSEYWLIYIGFLSGIALMLATALAKTTFMLAYGGTQGKEGGGQTIPV